MTEKKVDWDVKNQINQNKKSLYVCSFLPTQLFYRLPQAFCEFQSVLNINILFENRKKKC